ncbi:hypothetical protein PV08_03804 [Exophiala spinifera]|uniref:Uncharacterized protein n=1 Tax=Exophiala spinifera TaxID=91928 RepID=A0A0D1YNG0_9EURO|nr:uncharacterized protein PV08_03804 [Exophiala spinifera]KIW16616.1 hypothetical protein PV08_03804 [Exophiala spinifera]
MASSQNSHEIVIVEEAPIIDDGNGAPSPMTSSQNSVEIMEETPVIGGGDSVPSGSTKFERYFPEDPFGGGVLMAVFNGKGLLYRRDTYFQAKLTTAERIFRFSPQYRFRGADVNITVWRDEASGSKPSITKVFPTVLAVDVSEREVQDTNEVIAGAGASAGPGQVNTSVKQTHHDKANFQGRRKLHGLVKGHNTASWRLYEEPGSQSGIPSIFRLVTLVRCLKGGFKVQLEVSARMVKWPKLFGLHNLFFDSGFSARSYIRTVSPQPIPFDWRKLYEEAKNIIPDDRSDRENWNTDVSEFRAECEAAGSVDGKKKMLVGFYEDLEDVGGVVRKVKVTALAGLKEYLASQEESKKFIKRLRKGMEIPVPEEQKVSSLTATETSGGSDADDEDASLPRVSMPYGLQIARDVEAV